MRMSGLIGFCAVVVLSGPSLAVPSPKTADLAGAKAYVDGIYRALPGLRFDYRSVRYAPELQRWLDRDDRASAGAIGAIDAVPFCECQDTMPNYRFETRVVNTVAGATAHVRLRNGKWQAFRIDLIPSSRGWLVADIHSNATPSLLAYLRRAVPPLKKSN